MKNKILVTVLLTVCVNLLFSSCSPDEDLYDNSAILGSWKTVSYTESDYFSSTLTLTWSFFANNTATERVIAEMGGYVITDKTLSFSYVYKGNTIVLTTQNGEEFTYEIDVRGNYMKLGNAEDGYFDLTKAK